MRYLMRVGILLLMVGVFVAALGSGGTAAGRYPNRPIELYLGSAPGGSADILLRFLAEALKKELGQPVVISYHPGAGGGVMMADLMQRQPDGYTIAFGAAGYFTTKPHQRKVNYSIDDFEFIAGVDTERVVVAVMASSPWKTLQDLIEYAKKNPNKVRVGVPGLATIQHLAMGEVARKNDLQLLYVPHDGGSEAVASLLGRNVDVAVVGPSLLKPSIAAGKIRALTVFSAERDPELPDVPVARELGVDFEAEVWRFVFARKGTPAEALQSLRDAFQRAMRDKDFLEKATKAGLTVAYKSPEQCKSQLKREYEFWKPIMEALGLTAR